MPKVSVVTPVWNGERYLAECIESVLGQTFQDWEYIIVNNKSTDATASIIERYSSDCRIRVYNNTEYLSSVDNFNRYADLINREASYLKFVCADDYLFPRCLEEMVGLAETDASIRVVGAHRLYGEQLESIRLPYPRSIFPGKYICSEFFKGHRGVFGSPTDHLIRLDREAGYPTFDPHFSLYCDVELFIRLLKDGANYGFVHQLLSFNRLHSDSLSSRVARPFHVRPLLDLAILLRHGDSLFSQKGMTALVKKHRRRYADYLVRKALLFWDREIWNYHQREGRRLGVRIGFFELVWAGMRELGRILSHPHESASRLLRLTGRKTT